MSNSEYLGRTTKQFHPKELKRIVNRAHSLVRASMEPNPTVRLLATIIIEDFGDIAAQPHKMSFKEGVTAAKLASSTPPHQCEKWEHTCAATMASNTLEMAAKIEMRTMSFNKALVQLNRAIEQREKMHTRHAEKNESYRQPKPTIPIDSTSGRRSSKPSPKQPYRRARTQRRKAA